MPGHHRGFWPDVQFERAIGAIAVEFAFDWTWIDRREHLIEFIDDTTIRVTARIHFTMPARTPYELGEGATIVMPLDILRKGDVLLHAELRGAEGELLSPLNKQASSRIAGLGLVTFFRRRMGNAFPVGAAELIEQLAHDPADAAKRSCDLLLSLPGFRDYSTGQGSGASTRVTRENEARLLTDELTDGFLYAVALEYRPRLTHVVEFAYDAPQPWSRPEAGRTSRFLTAIGAFPRPQFSALFKPRCQGLR